MPDKRIVSSVNHCIHSGHRARLVDTFMKHDLRGMYDHQLLELLLFCVLPRTDTNPTSHRLLQQFGSIGDVLNADRESLLRVDGIGARAAEFLNDTGSICNELHDLQYSKYVNTYQRFTRICRKCLRFSGTASAFLIDRNAMFCGSIRLETDPSYEWNPDFRELERLLRRDPIYYVVIIHGGSRLPENLTSVLDFYTRLFTRIAIDGECLILQGKHLYKALPCSGVYTVSAKSLSLFDEELYKSTFKRISSKMQKLKCSDDDLYSM